MATKIAINGFGRIGRLVFRNLMEREDLEVVAINDIAPLDNLAYLLGHDSVQRNPDVEVKAEKDALTWGSKKIPFMSVREPEKLPWKDMGAKLVVEASGVFTSMDGASKHLTAGAERVIISAPGKGVDLTVCVGVNEDKYDPEKHKVISNASCTTNCLAPVAKVLNDEFKIETGFLTTVHAVTASQTTVDAPHKKWRRGRSALVNIVPTTTGAAKAATVVLPELEGKLDGMALRVPVPDGSIIDLVARTEKEVSIDKVNEAFKKAAKSERLKGILGVSEEELVSSDIIGCTYSSLVDLSSTMVLGKNTVKVLSWYDNEWGYSRRTADLAAHVAK